MASNNHTNSDTNLHKRRAMGANLSGQELKKGGKVKSAKKMPMKKRGKC